MMTWLNAIDTEQVREGQAHAIGEQTLAADLTASLKEKGEFSI